MNDFYQRIGRLIHFGLDIRADPSRESEYADLLKLYDMSTEFRNAVQDVCWGQGLEIAGSTERGIVLVAAHGSVYRAKPAEIREGTTAADDRLIEGFIHLGIAASVFPRPELLDDIEAVPHPVTVAEVEERLRQVCARFAEEAKDEPDPELADVERGLIAAWRVYEQRASEGSSRKRVGASTRVLIAKILDMLSDQGMFLRRRRGAADAYQATDRYFTQVRELQVSRAFERVQDLVASIDASASTN